MLQLGDISFRFASDSMPYDNLADCSVWLQNSLFWDGGAAGEGCKDLG